MQKRQSSSVVLKSITFQEGLIPSPLNEETDCFICQHIFVTSLDDSINVDKEKKMLIEGALMCMYNVA